MKGVTILTILQTLHHWYWALLFSAWWCVLLSTWWEKVNKKHGAERGLAVTDFFFVASFCFIMHRNVANPINKRFPKSLYISLGGIVRSRFIKVYYWVSYITGCFYLFLIFRIHQHSDIFRLHQKNPGIWHEDSWSLGVLENQIGLELRTCFLPYII